MFRNMLLGVAAGAAGTAALNLVTYSDMAVRGRPASTVPADVVDRAAGTIGVPLGSDEEDQDTVENRKSGLGALLGYDTGLGIGMIYGLARPLMRDVPRPLAGVGLGLAAMLASDVPATALGVTNPKEWTADSWLSDLVPHLAYGLVTAFVLDEFRKPWGANIL